MAELDQRVETGGPLVRENDGGSRIDTVRFNVHAPGGEAIRCSKRLDCTRCTPLRVEQSVLQEVVVPARPVPGFPLPPLLQKPERLE